MQNKRGSIFKPFAALKGFDDAIKEKEEIKYEKPVLSSDKLEELQEEFSLLSIGSSVYVKFYKNSKFYEIEGIITKIDTVYKRLVIVESGKEIKVEINNIIDLKVN